ncbi:GDP-mannose 4,6-dehydratase [bacterium]|nr:GDP-mannose 4,6-dehydratase [candidate division CSSED10-310 bacterium]
MNSQKGPVAVVTGGCGFAGSYLVKSLAERSMRVHLFDTQTTIPGYLNSLTDNITVHKIDLANDCQLDTLMASLNPREIYHLAGIANVKSTWNREYLTYQVNLLGTVNLLSAIRNSRVEADVLIVSTGEVYGKVDLEHQPITEMQTVNPRSPYAASKLSMEIAVRQFARQLPNKIVIVRPFNHIGPGQHAGFVTADFAMQITQIEREEIPPVIKVGDLSTHRDFTDVRDMIEAYIAALKNGQHMQTYNASSGKAIQIKTMLQWLLNLSDKEIRIVQESSRFPPADIQYLCGSHDFLTRDTSWEPRRDIRQTLNDILNYWRSLPEGNPAAEINRS